MKPSYWCIVGFAALLFVVSCVAFFVNLPDDSTGGMAKAGQSGDYWGGHFAGLGTIVAALLFVVAIFLQRDELKAQREELALTRAEMARAREVSTAQVEQLTEQTQIARHSAVVSRILDVIQYRSKLAADQRDHNVLEPTGAVEFERIARQAGLIYRYLDSLLQDAAISESERLNLAIAARLDNLETVKDSYGSLQLGVARHAASEQLQLTLTFTNVSPFQFRLGNAFFCCPQYVEGREDTAGQPKWTVHHRTMQLIDSAGAVSTGVSRRFVTAEWKPSSRERVEMAPDDTFSCRLETPGHTFTLKDGAGIKKSILNNMGP